MPVSHFFLLLTLFSSILCFYHKKMYAAGILHPYSTCRSGQMYRLFSAGFIHNTPLHLLSNLCVLYIFGEFLCERIEEINRAPAVYFPIIYLGSLLGGNLATTWLYRKDVFYTSAGSSGGTLGIMLSYLLLAPDNNLLHLPFLHQVPTVLWIIMYAAGLTYLTLKGSDNRVNYAAHLFGAGTGMLLSFLCFFPELKKMY